MKEKLIVRIVSVFMAATGLFVIAKDWRAYLQLHHMLGGTLEMLGPLFTAFGLAVMLIPFAKFAAAIGLFLSKRWGWFTAVAVLTVDFLVGLQLAIRMCIFSFQHSALDVPPPDPNTVVRVVGMGPTYIVSIISFISVVALLRKPIRNGIMAIEVKMHNKQIQDICA